MLSALEDYKDDIAKFMNVRMARELEKSSLMQITITHKNITLALERVVNRQIKEGHLPDAEYNINKAVKAEWPKIKARAIHVWGADSVKASRAQLVITIWDNVPGFTGRVQKSGGFPKSGITEFKGEFVNTLRAAGVQVGKMKHTMDPGRGGATLTGQDAFRQMFSVSHLSPNTEGQQAGRHLQQKVKGERARAGRLKDDLKQGTPSAADLENAAKQAGREKFWDLTDMKMSELLPAATYIQVYADKTDTILGSKIPGAVRVEVEFDEIDAQQAAGIDTKVDMSVLRLAFREFVREQQKELEKELLGAKGDRFWELQGSESRKDAFEKVVEIAMIDSLVRGSKGRFKPVKKTRKPNTPKSQKTKKSSLSNKIPRRKTKSTANTSKSTRRSRSKRRAIPWRNRGGVNPLGLKQLIMKSLPDHVAKKMTGPPTLQYRTGRFARSAEITDIAPLPNSVEIRYDYMQDPYRIFEEQGGRDPRKLIGSSIREIAQLIMGNRFGLVRTKRI